MNQIKQDYAFARYLLALANFECEIVDAVDQDVVLQYPLDWSAYGGYVEMMKASFRYAVDTLDKVAFFAREYFGLTHVRVRDTNFRTIWSEKTANLVLRPELRAHAPLFLYGLMDLAHDLANGGAYGHIYRYRHGLTHRYFVVHFGEPREAKEERGMLRVSVEEFFRDTVLALRIAKSAVTQLILCVDLLEERLDKTEGDEGIPISFPAVDLGAR